MYSYHSRAGGSKGGHGGRNYRPPPERRDKETTPPPIKECTCLIEIYVDEYAVPSSPQPRIHESFGGRPSMESCKKQCRQMRCHLVVPGRNQSGPVSIVAGCYRDALSALRWLLESIVVNGGSAIATTATTTNSERSEENETISGRIIFDVKNGSGDEKVGEFSKQLAGSSSEGMPHFLFKCNNQDMCILVCKFVEETAETSERSDDDCSPQQGGGYHTLSTLTACFDNVKFRRGSCTRASSSSSTIQLESFLGVEEPYVFAFGSKENMHLLSEEIKSMRLQDTQGQK